MVGAGGLMVLLTLIGVVLLKTGKLQNSKLYLKVMLFAMVLPYIANTTGWLITEMAVSHGLYTVCRKQQKGFPLWCLPAIS